MYYGPILCVDDESSNLAVLRGILKDKYEMVFAKSGEDALRLVAKHNPGLILLDILMPDMDGFEVCRRLKANPVYEDIPVIFITALSDEINEKMGFDLGGVDYITKPVSPAVVLARVKTHLSLVRSSKLERIYRDAIFMLGTAGHFNDTETGAHTWRMAAYTRVLAEAIGWSEEKCELIELAAAMHDTGKIGIPDSVLKSTEKLTAPEFDLIKSHTWIGFEILSLSDAPLFQLAAEIALYHHERWDGSGYPAGLAAEAIPESARIVAVADVFDALMMKRPYKAPWSIEKTVALLKAKSGSHFEPRVIDKFIEMMPVILHIKERWDTQDEKLMLDTHGWGSHSKSLNLLKAEQMMQYLNKEKP